MRHLIPLLVAGCAGSPAAHVAPALHTTAAIAPEMAELAFYVGHWQCRATDFDDHDKITSSYDLTVDVAPRLDGSWFQIVVTKDGVPITSELKGYSKADKKFHHVWAMGEGSWGALVSPGWTGSQMVFDSEHVVDGDPPERAIFEKLGETRYAHTSQARLGERWHTTFTKTCVKT